MSQEITELVSQLPVWSTAYANDGNEFTIDCVANALVRVDEIINVFSLIRRRLPKIDADDVRSEVFKVRPGPDGEVAITWRARTEHGRIYLAELAKQIGMIMQKQLTPMAAQEVLNGVPALLQHADNVLNEHAERARSLLNQIENQNDLDNDFEKTETAPLSLENKRNPE